MTFLNKLKITSIVAKIERITGEKVVAKKEMPIEKYVDDLQHKGEYEPIIDEMYWGHAFSSEKMLDYTLDAAKHDGVTLTGVDDFDSDKVFTNIWKSSEKGLS